MLQQLLMKEGYLLMVKMKVMMLKMIFLVCSGVGYDEDLGCCACQGKSPSTPDLSQSILTKAD